MDIDETLYTRRKAQVGRFTRNNKQWVFGGLCRETDECFVVAVPDRGCKTLLQEIKTHIEPGSTIYSDSWRAYKTDELNEAGFDHLRVNHRYNFIDPDTAKSA